MDPGFAGNVQMTLKRLILVGLLLFAGLAARAQVDLEAEFFSLPDSLTGEYLDSVKVQKMSPNNYWAVGAYGGVTLNYGMFNPTRYTRWMVQYPVYGFSFIRHYTMFNMFPNMALEFGAQMGHEGYEFKINKETGKRTNREPLSGAYKIYMRVPEVFFLTHFHGDLTDHFKLMFKIGLYAGYRLDIKRDLDEGYADLEYYQANVNRFMDYDRRASYGVRGGVGFGLMFDPIEIHVIAQGKWGWNSFWNPDYAHQYYYRFGYPLDAGLTIGLYYQLTPRFGHTGSQLRKLAKKIVEEENAVRNAQY